MAKLIKSGAFKYERPTKPKFQNCKHCGIMVSADTAGVRSRGKGKYEIKYHTTECAICRRNNDYKRRERLKRERKR